MNNEYLTIQEAATFFRVSTRTLRRWEEKGYLTSHRTFGNQRRYSKAQLSQLLGAAVKDDEADVQVSEPASTAKPFGFQSQPQHVPQKASISQPTPMPIQSTPVHTETSAAPLHHSQKPEPKLHKPQAVMTFGAVIALLLLTTLIVIGFSNAQGLDEKRQAFISFLKPGEKVEQVGGQSVLAAEDRISAMQLQIGVPALFTKKVTFLDAFEIKNSLTVNEASNLFGGIKTNNKDIDAGTGRVIASNIVYSVLAGTNISITGDPQNPVIAALGGVNSVQGLTGTIAFTSGNGIDLEGLEIANTGVLSLQGENGDVAFSSGSGIGLSGLTITNTDPGSAQKIFGTIRVGSTDISAGSNTDTFTISAGAGITLSPDSGNKTVTITSNAAGVLSGLTTNGVLYATSATTATSTNAGANGFILKSTGPGTPPEWVAPGTVLGYLPFDFLTDGTNTTANMIVGTGASLGFTGSGTINASSLQNATWIAPGAIGSSTPNTGAFTALTATTLNGLTVTANGSNTLNIATGKTITLNSSLTLSGTDGTAFTFPSANDTLVGRNSNDTLTNKTIAAGSNTITGLTNSNLSGSAGITNANLANSSVTVTAGTGLSGGGVVSLGGSVSLQNAGVTSATAGSGIQINAATGDITITNNGVTSAVAGSGIGINASTGAVTFTNNGVTSLTGTTNQVNVSGSTGGVTLSLPQDIHTGASPTFAGMTLASFVTDGGLLYANGSGSFAQSSTLFAGVNGLGVGSNAIGNGKLVINQQNASGDIFSASSSGTTRLTLSNNGNLNLTGGAYQSNGISGITQGSASCVTTTNGIVTGFGTCQLGSEQWEINNGAIYTGNMSLDLLLGGSSTGSAKFAVTNISGGTPTASISANSGNNAAYLAGNGVLGTTNAQTLTVGSASTGNVVIDAGSGSIILSDATTVNGGVNLSLGNGYSINGTSVLNASTLGSGVTASSLTSVGALASGSIANGFGTILTANTIQGSNITASGTTGFTGSGAGAGMTFSGSGNHDVTASLGTLRFGAATLTGAITGNSQSITGLNNFSAAGTITLGGLTTGIVKSNGSGVLSSSAVGLNTGDVTGTLAVGNGGTGTASTPTNGQLLIGNGTGYTLAGLTNGTAISISNGAGTITINNTGVTSAVAGSGIGVSGATGAVTISNSGVLSLTGTTNQVNISGSTGAVTLSLPQNIHSGASPTFAGLTLSGFTSNGGILYTNGSGILAQTSVGGLGQCLMSNGGGTPTWGTCAGGTNLWQSNNGTVSPFSNTLDLLVGGTSTTSAKFRFINTNSGTPTASISANSGNNAAYLDGTGVLGTTNAQTLTLGSSTTGNVVIDSGSGLITLSDNTTVAGNLNLQTGNAFQINSTNVLTNNTLGSGVTTSSLTTVGALASGSIASGFGTILTANTIQGSNITASGTTGFTGSGVGAGLTFSGSGNHDITASLGTLRFGAATLTGAITGNSQNLTGLANLGATGTITFGGLTTGVVQSNGSGVLSSSALNLAGGASLITGTLPIGNGGTGTASTATNGQLLIGNGSGYTLAGLTQGTAISISNGAGAITINNTGVTSITGTTNQVNASGSTGAVTLSLPQNIHSGASPTFAGLTLSGLTNCDTIDTNGSGVLSCGTDAGATNYWQSNNGAVSPSNSTNDFLIGGTATASARFSVTGMATTLGGVSSFSTANSLPAGRTFNGVVAANGYIYSIGGYNGGGQSTAYYAALNADGSVGDWRTTSSLPTSLSNATAVVYNGYVYVAGGQVSITLQNKVYYARLNTDGTLGSWQTATNLPQAIQSQSSVVANGYLYMLGGSNNVINNNINSIYYAKINSDGSIGAWTTNGTNLPAATRGHTSVVANGYVYMIGGNASGGTTNVYFAKLNGDGSVGSWTSTNGMPAARVGHSSVVANGYVYAMGGDDTSNAQDEVFFAKLNDNGTVGTWATNQYLIPGVRGNISKNGVIENGYMYVVGGSTTTSGTSGIQSTVYYASTARISMNANLDLIGLSGGNIASASGMVGNGAVGGSVFAGNIFSNGSLTVAGNAQMWNGLSVNGEQTINGALSIFGTSGTAPAASISASTAKAAFMVDNNGVGDLFTASKSGATKFVITNSGNVGIGGVTNPGNPLYVAGNTSGDSVLFTDGPGSLNYLAFGTNRTGGGYNDIASIIGGVYDDLILQRGGGRVGIGLTDPNYDFDVRGISSLNYIQNPNIYGANIGGGILFSQYNAGTAENVYLKVYDANAGFVFENNGAATVTLATLTGAASFGLGTNNFTNLPDGSLHVGNGALCVDDGGSNCDDASRLAGRIYAESSTVTAIDLAENYPSKDNTLEPGDLVIADPNNTEYVKRSENSYQGSILGIVSTKPGILLGGFGDEERRFGNDKKYPIALAGRIPTKVSTENGPIKPGDYLTSSSIPGVAMKATQAGTTIAKAVESYNNPDPRAVGKVVALVNPSWYDPRATLSSDGNISVDGKPFNPQLAQNQNTNISDDSFNARTATSSALTTVKSKTNVLQDMLAALTTRVSTLEDSASSSAFMTSAPGGFTASSAAELDLEKLDVNKVTVTDTLAVVGRTTLADVGITGKVNVGLLSIEGLDNEGSAAINTSVGALRLQSNGLNGIDILNGKITIDNKGNMKSEGEITAKKVNIDTEEVASASLGEVVLKEGQTKVIVKTSALSDKSKIFVQAEEIPVTTAVKKTAADTFEIRVRSAESTDVRLSWWIVN